MSVSVRDAVRRGAFRLREAGIGEDNAARESAVLLSHCMGVTLARLYMMGEDAAPAAALACYRAAIERRRAREPLQYITGVQEFMSLEFRVDRRVLVPRPETETLVETVLEFLHGLNGQGAGKHAKHLKRFADAGTGSGAIAVSVAKYAGCGGYALDASGDALDVARLNAKLLDVDDRIEFLEGDLLEPLAGRVATAGLDCVVSNPPYVTGGEYARLQPEVRDFEPRIALLCDDVRGSYGRLARQAACFLRPGGLLAVEVGYGQADTVARVFAANGMYGAMKRVEDLRGIERVVCCRLERNLEWGSAE